MLNKIINKYRSDGITSVIRSAPKYLNNRINTRVKRVTDPWQRPKGTDCSALDFFKLRINSLVDIHLRGKGQSVTEKDWDNLIILDACRYDMYQNINTTDGKLSPIMSVGSNTNEFLRRTFRDKKWSDIVYVSANVQPANRTNAEFHEVFHLWNNNWDNELETVHPEDTVKESLQIAERFPHKRLVIHFLQPHYPFIGEQGQKYHNNHGHKRGRYDENVWVQLNNGEVSAQTIKQAYYENLEVTLPHVQQLVKGIQGKTVVTSDHGNAIGESGLYGHAYPGIYIDPLRKVPWHVIKNNERKRIVDEGTADNQEQFDNDVVQERLEKLGYVNR